MEGYSHAGPVISIKLFGGGGGGARRTESEFYYFLIGFLSILVEDSTTVKEKQIVCDRTYA